MIDKEKKINNKLVITNPVDCMKILQSLINKEYPEEQFKYAAYVSMAYFVTNMYLFSNSDVEKILNNETLKFSISSKLTYELLDNAVKNKKIFNNYSKKWFSNVKANQLLLTQYLEILLKSDDNKQIEDFCNSNPVLSKNYFKTHYSNPFTSQNYTFKKYVIGNNPDLISKSTLLLEKDVVDLVNKNLLTYKHLIDVFNSYSYKLQTLVTHNEIKFILEYDLEKTDVKQDLFVLISNNALFFIKKLQEVNPEFTHKLLSSSGIPSNSMHPQTIPNFLQSILEHNDRFFNSSNTFEPLIQFSLNNYKDLFFQDVTKKLGKISVPYKQNYFLYLYENNILSTLETLSFSQNELNQFEKDIVLSSCFEQILNISSASANRDIAPYVKPLLNYSYTILSEALNKLKDIENISPNLLLKLETYFLSNKLQETLSIQKHETQKMKI